MVHIIKDYKKTKQTKKTTGKEQKPMKPMRLRWQELIGRVFWKVDHPQLFILSFFYLQQVPNPNEGRAEYEEGVQRKKKKRREQKLLQRKLGHN